MNEQLILLATRRWIDQVVVGLGLCPFAEPSIARDGLRMKVCLATDSDGLSAALVEELHFLQTPAGQRFDSSLLIHPHAQRDFEHYNDYLDRCDEILEKYSLVGEFQIASFHPQYRFAGGREHDPGNYTNRSPYPMLHVLREASVARAIERHPDPDSIPAANIRQLEKLGEPAMLAILAACRSTEDL